MILVVLILAALIPITFEQSTNCVTCVFSSNEHAEETLSFHNYNQASNSEELGFLPNYEGDGNTNRAIVDDTQKLNNGFFKRHPKMLAKQTANGVYYFEIDGDSLQAPNKSAHPTDFIQLNIQADNEEEATKNIVSILSNIDPEYISKQLQPRQFSMILFVIGVSGNTGTAGTTGYNSNPNGQVMRDASGSGSSNEPGYLPDYQGDRYTDPQRILDTQALNKEFFDSIGGAPSPPPLTPAQQGMGGDGTQQYQSGNGVQYQPTGGYGAQPQQTGYQQQQPTGYNGQQQQQIGMQPQYQPTGQYNGMQSQQQMYQQPAQQYNGMPQQQQMYSNGCPMCRFRRYIV
ncbi:unnamed protein product [Caenorhabditis bovis]|uniref:Uncharacterized protein n=1 Tax=Caenorhabditis bovis TaxID=2654633 RepID=A0A8S1EPB2_9PELO|nr:unnamed protein product [Caenorhabditis bovis]